MYKRLPLEKTSKYLVFIGFCFLMPAAALFILNGISVAIFGNSSNDTMVIVGAASFFASLISAALGIVFGITGYVIVWVTHFRCKADKAREEHIRAKNEAKQHVAQFVVKN